MAMKESGIEWVGLIPDTWSVIPNKYVMHKEKNLCGKWTGEDVMSLTMNGVIVRDLQNPTGKMPATFDGYQYIEDGDLLMCLFDMDVTPRCVGKVTHDGVTSPAYSNFKVHDIASRDYFYYYYLMVDNTKELLHLAKNLRHSFTEEQLGQLKVPIPPLFEQQAIADYLDETCSKIDEIIAEAKASIDEYKLLKESVITNITTHGFRDVSLIDSGSLDIGMIPNTWSICKTLYGLTMPITDGPHVTPELLDDGIAFVSAEAVSCGHGSIDFNHMRGYISEEFYNECCKKYIPQRNDIYMIKSGATTGTVSIVDTDRKFTIWSPLAVFRVNRDRLIPKYLFYFLQSKPYQQQVQLGWTFGTQQNIGMRTLEQLKICMPPLVEQVEIVEYLDDKLPQIEFLIAEKESLINDLEAYKKSLIYEVVTGKRRVV